MFFYRCTDDILFTPLPSQGADHRLNYIRTSTIAAIPPCSPENIYTLANLVRHSPIAHFRRAADTINQLGIQPLCDKALADIEGKMTSDNTVSAVFSQFAAGWVHKSSSQLPRANLFVQSQGGHGDAVQSSDFELQGAENDCSCEGEHQTYPRWISLPLCGCTEPCV